MFPKFEKYSLYPESKGTITSSNTLPMKEQTAVEYLKSEYIKRGDTLPSGVFQEALEMESKQMKDMYLKGIENYDPTFKRKSQWTEVDNMTKRLK